MRQSFSKILIDSFGVPEEDIKDAAQHKLNKGGSIGDILVMKKSITEKQLLVAYTFLYDLPIWAKLPPVSFGPEFTQKIPIQFLKQYRMVPIEKADSPEDSTGGRACVIAVNNPASLSPAEDLARLLEMEGCKLVLASRDSIASAINDWYDSANVNSAEQLVQDMEDDASGIMSEIEETADLLDDTSDAPIIKLVNHVISKAIKERASDIHMQPQHNSFKIRYRIDGILYDMLTPPKRVQPALISRIKIMAKLNIAEKRLPQDGRFEVRIGDQMVDLRVSTIPTSFGERIVMRLLSKSSSLLKLEDIGVPKDRLDSINRLIRNPNGIMLVTGPTGSGKTTTLYAVLTAINTPDINIITVEDPVEYQISGIGQIQVNSKIGLTFASGLRAILRQDPDVILIGEIRDQETAEIAIQSALTGHLVLSTLHTNDSAGTMTRLVDMGIEPFLISSSLLGIIAQRLVRVLCDECREPYVPDRSSLEGLGVDPDDFFSSGAVIYQQKGCHLCFNTGFRGRLGIYELMVLNDEIKSLIVKTSDANSIKKLAKKEGMVTLREDGIAKLLNGTTTIDEIIRVTHI